MWVVNTDAQALGNHSCPNKLQIGAELTRGLGTGGKSELGEQAALESVDELSKVSSSSNNNMTACRRSKGQQQQGSC
jgi:cell division protein FtsZ